MVSHVVIKGFVWFAMLLLKDFMVSHVVIKGSVWLAMLLLKDLYG